MHWSDRATNGQLRLAFGKSSTFDDLGPRLTGYFDFTLLFEQAILSIVPSALFILAAIFRLAQLNRRPPITKPGWLLGAKLVAYSALIGLQSTLLALWTTTTTNSRASVPAAALGLASAILAAFLSDAEHRRCIRPSSVLGCYFWFATLLDLAQTRSLFLQSELLSNANAIAPIFAALQAVRATLIALEECPKRRFLSGSWPAESTSGPLCRCLFWWLNSLFLKGYKCDLRLGDLDKLDDAFASDKLLADIQATLDKGDSASPYLLIKASWVAYRIQFLAPILPRLFASAFNFAQPLLINRIIAFVTEPQDGDAHGIAAGLVAATGLIYVGRAISEGLYRHTINQFITTLRGGLAALIFQKVTKLDAATAGENAAVTLMSTDIDAITSDVLDFHEIWANTLELGVAMYLLHREIGPAFFLVAIPAIVCSYLSTKLGDGIGPARMEWSAAVQQRVADTSAMLSQIKSLKMMGLTDYMGRYLGKLRVSELDMSKKFRRMIVLLIMTANISDQFTPAIVITAAVFWTRNDGLTISQAFTALSIMNLISTPIAQLVGSYPSFMDCLACFQRIQTFLLAQERKDDRITDDSGSSAMISLKNVSASFPGKEQPVLLGVTTDIRPGSFTMVIGPVGSGKSALLKTILGELPITDGAVFLSRRRHSIAFCDQTPWLRNGSVRSNILAGSAYEHEWYATVVRACALTDDIERFPDRDDTIVGSGGITLSGGQKQRVALARALYSRNKIVLLDDVFSALDSTTSRYIFNSLLKTGGILRETSTTVVLTTHAVHYLPYADNIIALDESGKIQQSGTFAELHSQEGYVKDLAVKHHDDTSQDTPTSDDTTTEEKGATTARKDEPADRQFADWSLFKFYLKSAPAPMIAVFVLLGSGYIIVGRMPMVWIRVWTEHGTTNDTGLYFTVYIAICVFAIILSALSPLWFTTKLIPRSAVYLHQQLLDTYLAAPLWFLTSTDNGVLLNRFSQDMTMVDAQMPMAFFETTLNVTVFIVLLVLVAQGAKYLAACIPVTMVMVYAVQRFYVRTSQQMRHLELESKSPLYSHFTETVAGIATIRAFGWEDDFLSENLGLLDRSQRPYYTLMAIQQWLALVMGLFTAGVSVLLIGLAVAFTNTTSGGAIGLAMVNLMNFNGSISFLIRSWTNMETSLGAAARIRSFVQDTPAEARPSERQQPPNDWPSEGGIEVHGVSAAYKPGGDTVLRNISLEVQPGQKVGICGRTGSGKSSLVLTILRLLEMTSGSIRIDGIDLAAAIRQCIRTQLTVLPQDPVKLPGTVRDNLDPERLTEQGETGADEYRDHQLHEALQKARIWDKIREAGGLDVPFGDVGLSHGQHQLFALARTFLRKSKVVILDEATSSVDGKTDEEMRHVLNDMFEGCTVVTVAHRLESIVDGDLVLVMDDGGIVETGNPQELKDEEGSVFRGLWEARHG